MIKKPLGLLLSGILTIGLAACNNNSNNAADEVRTGMGNRNNTTLRDNTTLNVRNGRDNGIDHNGLLTEDYTNNDNNDSDWDRNNRNNVTNVNNDRTTNRYNKQRNVNYNLNTDRHIFNDRNVNYNNNRNVSTNNDALNISADRTNVDSKNYPHTKAILMQHAQYRYIPFGSAQWYQFGGNQQGQTPRQQQVPIVPAPAAPAPTAPVPTVPAPAPTAPAPTTPAPTAPAPKP
ncbi:hypothetical protein V7111_17015, partial [Neobacillus niacini]